MLRIVRFRVRFQYVFHTGHNLRVLLWRNHPILALALRHAIFVSVLRTVS